MSLITGTAQLHAQGPGALRSGKYSGHAMAKKFAVLAALLTLSAVTVTLGGRQPQFRASVTNRDSIAYWAAGTLLLARENPYDYQRVLGLQRAQGYRNEKPLVLRTPPWSLWMIAWMGLVDPYWAWALWIVLLLTALSVAVRITWRMYGLEARPPTVFLLVAYLFAPVPACLVAGQLGIVLLLGTALFLWWQERHPMLAGMALLIPFAKPHLLVLFWPILASWICMRRKWSMLAGFLAATSTAVALSLVMDPAVFSDYHHMVTQASIQYEFIPAISGVVRLIFFRKFFWVQFVPLVAGMVWSVWYYRRHRTVWDWRKHGPALLVLSVLTAPYAWLTDEAILLPAILQAVLWVYVRRKELAVRSRLVICVFVCLNGVLLLLLRAKMPFATGIYFWSSLVWASWYWYSQSLCRKAGAQLEPKRALLTPGGQIDV